MADQKPLLLLVDGHSLAFRSFYAFAKGGDGGLSTKDGVPTSVTFGFLKSLLETCTEWQPQGIAIAFDTAEPTFRHEADETYKAHRDVAPEHFFEDLHNLQQILGELLDLPLVMAPGYEADDVLGTLAERAAGEGWRVRILSGDRDLFQLVDDGRDIAVLYLGGGPNNRGSGPREIRREEVVEKLGVPPEDVVDLKALTGHRTQDGDHPPSGPRQPGCHLRRPGGSESHPAHQAPGGQGECLSLQAAGRHPPGCALAPIPQAGSGSRQSGGAGRTPSDLGTLQPPSPDGAIRPDLFRGGRRCQPPQLRKNLRKCHSGTAAGGAAGGDSPAGALAGHHSKRKRPP
jgi:hypothetical protein